jgi:drug/metabolite transporter (DMT)-like permease
LLEKSEEFMWFRVLWPALIPLVLYGTYVWWRARRRARGLPVPILKNLRFFVLVLCLLMAAASLMFMAALQERGDASQYRPAHMNGDGYLTRGKVH